MPALYIEAGGDAMVVCAEKLEDVDWKAAINLCVSKQVFDRKKPWLWKEHEGTIIETRIPRDEVEVFTSFNGAADFIACRHPSHSVRTKMTAKLMEVYGAPEPSEAGRACVRAIIQAAGYPS